MYMYVDRMLWHYFVIKGIYFLSPYKHINRVHIVRQNQRSGPVLSTYTDLVGSCPAGKAKSGGSARRQDALLTPGAAASPTPDAAAQSAARALSGGRVHEHFRLSLLSVAVATGKWVCS